MARLRFYIPESKRPAAVKALKEALPKLKNAKACIESGYINCPTEHMNTFFEVFTKFTEIQDMTEDVEMAEERLNSAFNKLGGKITAKADATIARAIHAVADFIETL